MTHPEETRAAELSRARTEAWADLIAKCAAQFILSALAWFLWNFGVRAQFPGLPRAHYWFVFACCSALYFVAGLCAGRVEE